VKASLPRSLRCETVGAATRALRLVLACASALLLALTCARAASADLVRGGCIETHARGYHQIHGAGPGLEVWGTNATARAARGYAHILGSAETLSRLRELLVLGGGDGRLHGAGAGPYRNYVGPHTEAFFVDSSGGEGPICAGGAPADDRDPIAVPDNLGHRRQVSGHFADIRASTLTHELFHAFQAGVVGHVLVTANWFIDATAQWAAWTFAPRVAERIRREDQSVFTHPSWPLDLIHASRGHSAQRVHPYAEWRFIARVDGVRGRAALMRWIVDSLRAIAPLPMALDGSPEATAAEIANFPGSPVTGESFVDIYAGMWISDFAGIFPGRPRPPRAPAQDALHAGDGATAEWQPHAGGLAVRTLELDFGAPMDQVRINAHLPAGTAMYIYQGASDILVNDGLYDNLDPSAPGYVPNISYPTGNRDRYLVVFVNGTTDQADATVRFEPSTMH